MSAQRPLPFSTQSMANGSTSRGSPNETMGSAKRAVTSRTALTSPCGEKNSTLCATAVMHHGKSKTATSGPMQEGGLVRGGDMRVLEVLCGGGFVRRRIAAVARI